MKKHIIALLVAPLLNSATITVCASGCTTTNFQTALNTAVGGDIIQLTKTFAASMFGASFGTAITSVQKVVPSFG